MLMLQNACWLVFMLLVFMVNALFSPVYMRFLLLATLILLWSMRTARLLGGWLVFSSCRLRKRFFSSSVSMLLCAFPSSNIACSALSSPYTLLVCWSMS